jgi:hypothetical protein
MSTGGSSPRCRRSGALGDYFDTSKFNVSTLGLGALFDRSAWQIHYHSTPGSTRPSSRRSAALRQMILPAVAADGFRQLLRRRPDDLRALVTSQEVIAYTMPSPELEL